jgi:hypothetical protein
VGIVTWPSSPGRNGRPISAWFPANCSTSNERAGGSTHPYEVQDRELSLRQTATPGLEGGDPILLLAGNTSSLALKGSCLPPPLLGCTRPRNTVGHRIASLPTSHLLLCTDSDRVSDSPPGTTVHAANFFLDRRLSPRPARRPSAPRQPTLRGAFCFDNSRTRAGHEAPRSRIGRRPAPVQGNPNQRSALESARARAAGRYAYGWGRGRGDQPR